MGEGLQHGIRNKEQKHNSFSKEWSHLQLLCEIMQTKPSHFNRNLHKSFGEGKIFSNIDFDDVEVFCVDQVCRTRPEK